MPLFDGLESYRGMRRARAAAETITLAAVQTHANVRTEVRTGVLALREAAVRMRATKDNKERANEMLDIAQHSYKAGAHRRPTGGDHGTAGASKGPVRLQERADPACSGNRGSDVDREVRKWRNESFPLC